MKASASNQQVSYVFTHKKLSVQILQDLKQVKVTRSGSAYPQQALDCLLQFEVDKTSTFARPSSALYREARIIAKPEWNTLPNFRHDMRTTRVPCGSVQHA